MVVVRLYLLVLLLALMPLAMAAPDSADATADAANALDTDAVWGDAFADPGSDIEPVIEEEDCVEGLFEMAACQVVVGVMSPGHWTGVEMEVSGAFAKCVLPIPPLPSVCTPWIPNCWQTSVVVYGSPGGPKHDFCVPLLVV